MPLESTARSPLVSQVIAQLRTQITGGEWPVGARIPPEPELAARLGVGRNTLREAVKALSHAGLLDCRQGSGTYVLAASELSSAVARRVADAEHRDVIEVRRAFEVEAARLAARRRTAEDITRLDAALAAREEAWRSGDAELFIQADSDLHSVVVDCAHNPVLADLYADFGSALRASLEHVVGHALTPDVYVDHTRLVEAIRAGDAEAAAMEAQAFLTE
ncbi:FadR/GntR family transcriptional regulator [Longispora albida]|uniref:FadR/GntR family transcriptional regulator n=1 Tax=Longispora albida TaxID=203523 RepID=UPI00037BF8C6|nr:FCD domain-containing protein [Longispora albida]